MPEKTLLAYADHGEIGDVMATDGGDCEAVLKEFRSEGIEENALALQLQKEGGESFSKSWHTLLDGIAGKTESLGEPVKK